MISKDSALAAIKAKREDPPGDVIEALTKWPKPIADTLGAMWHLGMEDATRAVQGVEDEEPREARVIPSRTTDPATSHSAAKAVTVRAGTQRARLLIAFMELPDATDEEAMERADGVSPFSEYSKRCSELREVGMIKPTGETRPGISGQARIVSVITERGLDCLLNEVL